VANVRLPRSLAALIPGAPRQTSVEGTTVAEVIGALDAAWPGIRDRVCDAGPAIREHINVFVDGERALLDAPVAPESEVWILPAVSGG
jgi:molybdopterin converting factor small subunit